MNPWEAEKALKREFSKKYCTVPEELKNECDGSVIKAHTVSKSCSLAKIAKDGHVYGAKPSYRSLGQNQGNLNLQLVGINNASTFTGFCSKHDNELFLPIDNPPFNYTLEQYFLLGYRAISREVFNKYAELDFISQTMRIQSEMPEFAKGIIDRLIEGLNAGVRDITREKKKFDEVLLTRDYSTIKYYLIKLNTIPDIMGSGGITPSYDFDGNRLQNLEDVDFEFDLLTVSSFATSDAGLILFLWHSESNESSYKFIQSLHKISSSDLPNALIRLFFITFENIFIKPDWWENLNQSKQSSLNEKIMVGLPFNKPFEANTLMDDGQNYANWKIIDRVTNCGGL